jgi:hypothetical protein
MLYLATLGQSGGVTIRDCVDLKLEHGNGKKDSRRWGKCVPVCVTVVTKIKKNQFIIKIMTNGEIKFDENL